MESEILVAQPMIQITVELISARGPRHNKHLGRAEIANIGGTAVRGHYRYRVYGKGGKKMHEGTLRNMPRKKTNAWDLLTLLLTQERGEIIKRKLGL